MKLLTNQLRHDGSLYKAHSSGGAEKCSESGSIMKVEPTELAERPRVWCERKKLRSGVGAVGKEGSHSLGTINSSPLVMLASNDHLMSKWRHQRGCSMYSEEGSGLDIYIWEASVYRWASLIPLQCRRPWFNSWVRKITWKSKWQPTPVFLPGESHGQRSLEGYSPWGIFSLELG